MTVLASAPVAEDMASMPFCTSLICSSAVMYVRFTPCPLPEAWSQVCVHIWCPASCARFTMSACCSIWLPMVKNVALAVMLITFVTWLFAPAGAIVAAMFLLIVPGLAYSWHQVRRFGARKSAIQASNASAIVEHVTGMQTLRAYGIGGTANERIVESMRAFSDISYRYEAAVTPPGAVVFALVGMGAPALFLVCCNAVLAGTLDAVSAVLITNASVFE